MRYLMSLALPGAVLASALIPRESDPCAKIAKKEWMKPSQVNACLSSFAFNATLRDNTVDVLSKTFDQFHASTTFHLNMPDPFAEDTIDMIGELRRIKETTYSSDFELHRDVSTTVKQLGDAHAGYINYCYDSLYTTYLPFPLAVLANPEDLNSRDIYIVPEASKVAITQFGPKAIKKWHSALGRNLTEFNGARIVSINGQEPWAAVDAYAAVSGRYQAHTTRQNSFFSSYQLQTYQMGGFAQLSLPPSNNTVTLTLVRNGTNVEESYKVPYLSKIGTGTIKFSDSKSLWANNCLPTEDTNGYDERDTSNSAHAGVQLRSTLARRAHAKPARFQSDPIVPHVIGGRQMAVSSIMVDGPQFDVALPSELLPPKSLSGVSVMQWHVLDDKKTAVLHLSSFTGNFTALQQNVLDGLAAVKSKGATRLLIDLTNNGGGIICLAAWLHRVLAGPGPDTEPQAGLDGSVRARELPQKIVAKIVANNTGVHRSYYPFYNPLKWNNINSKPLAADFNWLNPTVDAEVNGVTDEFSTRVRDTCFPFDLTAPSTKPFEFENIAIMTNGQCASSCSLFSIIMHTKHNVRTVVVGGKPGTVQQYCGVVGGQSSNFAAMDSEVKTAGLKNDALAPPDFITNSYQGVTWKLGWSILNPKTFEEFQSHPAQINHPLLASTVNNPWELWKDVSRKLWPN
ncbi:hypothetical protein BDV93DRAFT_498597 [Ceratobasidium sp. AG-I]|nr:hypothetical protein BDV93DRAFT_498597 [Ceratobasidium sp. AG-I]